jgi:hypothetical protein
MCFVNSILFKMVLIMKILSGRILHHAVWKKFADMLEEKGGREDSEVGCVTTETGWC